MLVSGPWVIKWGMITDKFLYARIDTFLLQFKVSNMYIFFQPLLVSNLRVFVFSEDQSALFVILFKRDLFTQSKYS